MSNTEQDRDLELALQRGWTSEQHAAFQARLEASSGPVLAVAEWLHRCGRTVLIDGMRKAPTADQWARFVDQGDIHIVRLVDERIVERKVVQVRGIEYQWTGRADWPHPEFYVETVAQVERMAGNNVVVYVVVAQDRHHIGMVYANTQARWRRKWTTSRAGNPQEIFACSNDLVVWRNMIDPDDRLPAEKPYERGNERSGGGGAGDAGPASGRGT